MEKPDFLGQLTDEERDQWKNDLTDEERETLKPCNLTATRRALANRSGEANTETEAEAQPNKQATPTQATPSATNSKPCAGNGCNELVDTQTEFCRSCRNDPNKRKIGKTPTETEATAQVKGKKQAASSRERPPAKPAPTVDPTALENELRKATSAADVLKALARRCWYEAHQDEECPADQIPTEAALCAWIVNTSQEAQDEAAKRMDQMDQLEDKQEQDPVWKAILGNWRSRAIGWQWQPNVINGNKNLCATIVYQNGSTSMYQTLEYVHRRWLALPDDRPKHPLAPLVKAWQARPIPVEADTHDKGILPAVLKGTKLQADQANQADRDQLPLALTGGRIGEVAPRAIQGDLPFLETPRSGQLVPVLPLAAYDHNGGPLATRGRGAPIALRLLFEALMSLRREDRSLHQSAERSVTLRELVAWLWPNGWQRNRDLPALAWGLKDVGELRVEWERRLWNLVVARTLPTWDTRLDDPIVFHVFSLPGSNHGPLIDRLQLRRFGLQSAPAYRAYLRLAYLWDDVKARNGGYRILATRPEVRRDAQRYLVDAQGKLILDRGKPVIKWNHPRAVRTGKQERNPQADKVPQLGPEDLAILGYDGNPKLTREQIRERAKETRAALDKMEKQGAVVLEKDRHGGIRILEPYRGD